VKRGSSERHGRLAKAAGVVAAGLLAVPAGASAAAKPDLVVTAVANPPAEAHLGEDLPVELTIQNKGRRAAKASNAGLGLATSAPVTTPPEIELQMLDTPAIKPRRKKRVAGNVAIPEGETPGGPFYLLACADRSNVVKESKETNNCRTSTGQTELKAAPTSFDLIDDEYEAGQLTLGQVLLYKLYADYHDPAMPTRFGTPPDDPLDRTDILKKAAASFGSLPAADQAAIEPFFRPPIYQGAVFPGASAQRQAQAARRGSAPQCVSGNAAPQLAAGWSALETDHFKIHYFTAKPYPNSPEPGRSLEVAQDVAAVAEEVYAKLTPVFGVPLSDAAQPCNGGSAKIDVYAAKMRNNKVAQTLPYLPGAEQRPGWMFIDLNEVGDAEEVRDVFAHEFAHLGQLRNDYLVNPTPTGFNYEYGWLEEATATWAINHVYPEDNYEWRFNFGYWGGGVWRQPLGLGENPKEEIGYRDWNLFLFLTKDSGSTAPIANTFQAAAAAHSVDALNQGLGGDFAGRWKDFSLELLNRGDRDGFQQWDGITERLPMGSAVGFGDQRLSLSLNGFPTRELPLPQANNANPSSYDPNLGVRGRAMSYTSFDLPDANVRKLTFKGYGYRPQEGVNSNTKITAWFKTANGQYHEQNWSAGADKTFCRDDPDENITELVLFYTNGNRGTYFEPGPTVERPVYQQGKVELKDACDPVPYDVTFSGSSRRAGGGVIDATTQFDGTLRLDLYDGPGSGFSDAWEIVDGSLNVSGYSGTHGGCSVAGTPETFDLPAFNSENAPVMVRQGRAYNFNAPWVIYIPEQTLTVNFSGGSQCDGPEEYPIHGLGQWLTRTPTPLSPQPNGTMTSTIHLTEDPEWTHDLTFTLVPDYD
jgi:hypothetical protein